MSLSVVCARWFAAHAHGDANTGGVFDEQMYAYATSPEAQLPNNATDCFSVNTLQSSIS